MAKDYPQDPPVKDRSEPSTVAKLFGVVANRTSLAAGRASTFILAVLVVLVWALTGPLFGFSDTWQLVINTGTTIITFLMVFLIQNSQNRDSAAIQVKLDELIRASKGARNNLVDLESLSEEELEKLAKEFARVGQNACDEVERRKLLKVKKQAR